MLADEQSPDEETANEIRSSKLPKNNWKKIDIDIHYTGKEESGRVGKPRRENSPSGSKSGRGERTLSHGMSKSSRRYISGRQRANTLNDSTLSSTTENNCDSKSAGRNSGSNDEDSECYWLVCFNPATI